MNPTLFNARFHRARPFTPGFDRVFRDMDALFNASLRGLDAPAQPSVYGLKVHEGDDALLMTIALPGISQEEVELNVVNRELTVKVEGKSRVPEGFKPLRLERKPVNFWRKFTLAETLIPEEITAEMKDGLLRITLPKRPETQPRRIEIKVEGQK